MGDYLRSWGFSPQKPKKQAYEQCSKKVQLWLDEQYPAIKKRAKEENAEIQWGDETGLRNTNQHGRSYAPKGKTPVKKTMSKRFSINLKSASNFFVLHFPLAIPVLVTEMVYCFSFS